MKKIILIIVIISSFSFTSYAQYSKLLDFSGTSNGSYPMGTFISDGIFLYGMSYGGGTLNAGVIFKIKSDGTGFSKLLDFSGGPNGFYPNGALISDGTFLYGAASEGGTNGKGTIFKIKPDGTGFSKLLNFDGATNGNGPGSLISDGTFLYGTTHIGGSSNMGVIFKIKLDGTGYLKLLDFVGIANGNSPNAALISDGIFLYGMTARGGTNNLGTIYKIKLDGTGYLKLLDFNGSANGSLPYSSFISDGSFLYGTTSQGGINNYGTIFKIKADGSGYVKLKDFLGTDGANPMSSFFSDGIYQYGMTQSGGVKNYGTMFKIKPDGTDFSSLIDFDSLKGSSPYGNLISDGKFLYGMTQHAGINNRGTIFKYNLLCIDTIVTQSPILCFGQNIMVNSNVYTSSATYYDTLSSYHGCDSIVITNLIVLPSNTFSQSPIVCAGNGISVGTNIYSSSGIYHDTLLNYQGCDSIVITNLTVNPLPIVTITTSGSTNFCVGGNVVLDAGAGYVNYLWSNGNTSQTIPVTSSEHDSVTVMDGNGCYATSSAIIVSVNPVPVLTITSPSAICSPTTIDLSSSSVTFGSSVGAITYWEDIAGTVSLNASYYTVIDTSGTYYIKLDSGGCFDIKPVIITIYKDCIWPGDANHDSIVNNFDLLPIGLYYSQAGSPRTSISNAWQAFPSTDWGTLQTNGSDIKQVDCNGNGIIDNNDTLAVNLNFSLTHAIVVNNYSDVRTGDPAIYFITSSNSYNAGDWVNAEIWTGSSTIPVSNLYGFAFNINYDVSLVQPGTEKLTYPNNTWLGTPGTNAITVSKTDPLAATSYGGITRIDHLNANGFGKVADFKFQIKTNLLSISTFHLSVSNYKAIDAAGLPIVFAPSANSILLYPLTTAVELEGSIQEFTISPNPFSSQTTITFSKEQKHTCIKIMDVLGKEIKTINFTGKQLIIEKAEMQKGVYFVQLIDGKNNVVNKKIIVQ